MHLQAPDPASRPGSSEASQQVTGVGGGDRPGGGGVRGRTLQKQVLGLGRLMSLEGKEGFKEEGSIEGVPEGREFEFQVDGRRI